MTDGILDRLYSLDYIVGGHGKSMYAQAAAEIDRLRAANEDLDMVASLREQEIERLRAALDEIAHYWSGPIPPGWKEIARRALKDEVM